MLFLEKVEKRSKKGMGAQESLSHLASSFQCTLLPPPVLPGGGEH